MNHRFVPGRPQQVIDRENERRAAIEAVATELRKRIEADGWTVVQYERRPHANGSIYYQGQYTFPQCKSPSLVKIRIGDHWSDKSDDCFVQIVTITPITLDKAVETLQAFVKVASVSAPNIGWRRHLMFLSCLDMCR